MKWTTKLSILFMLVTVLIMSIGMNAYAQITYAAQPRNEGECWYWMNQAHEGAEIARRIGGDNAAILKYYGDAWTEFNNLRKEMVQRKQEEAQKKEQEYKANLQYLGNYQLTAYEYGTGPNSYNGKSQTIGYTAAADSIPGGTWLYIEGYGEYYVEDSGVGNSYTIDLFLGDPAACRQFGRKYNVPVYKILNR